MKRPARQTLTDLRPNATIHCMSCETVKAAAGAVKFHGLAVCATCREKLQVEAVERK